MRIEFNLYSGVEFLKGISWVGIFVIRFKVSDTINKGSKFNGN